MENKVHTVLFVDDEPSILSALKRSLRRESYRMLFAANTEEALETLKNHDVHLLLCDQRMPGKNGTELMAMVRDQYPDMVRIVLSGYSDIDTITDSINKGHVYKFFTKPWNSQSLKLEIKNALDYYELNQANKRLNATILKQNKILKATNENLEQLVRERTQSLTLQKRALEISDNILEELPLPIVCISAEGTIVVANSQARKLFDHSAPLAIGGSATKPFGQSVSAAIAETIKTQTTQKLIHQALPGGLCDLELIPLTNRRGSKGVIMILSAVHPKAADSEDAKA